MKSPLPRRPKTDLGCLGLVAVVLSLLVASLGTIIPDILSRGPSYLIALPLIFFYFGIFAGPGAVAGVIPLVALLSALERRGAGGVWVHALGITLGSILGGLNGILGEFLLKGALFDKGLVLVAIGAVSGATAGVCVSFGVLRRRRPA